MRFLLFVCFIALISCENKNQQVAILTKKVENNVVLNDKINGITLVATHNPIESTAITPIVNFNANYAVIVPYAWMKSLDQPQVYYNEERGDWGEKPHGVKKTTVLMKQQQLKVLLKPHLWIGRGAYTGDIDLKSEADWKILENSYTDYIMRFVNIAAQENIEIFCIGTELDSFVTLRPQFWDQLISKIRKDYKGKLTYAANWDNYDDVHFWEQLDYIGVDAYFPVSEEKTPSILTVKESWKKWKVDLSTLSRKRNKKILFTEYGYISADYAGKEPWKNAGEDRAINEEAQAVLYQGLYESLWNEEWMAGGFIWKYHAEESRWRGYEKRFTPQDKMAQDVITNYYGKN